MRLRSYASLATLFAVALSRPATVSANPETVFVDMRSTAMGNTGLAHFGGPGAVALNPANLARTRRLQLSLSAPLGVGQLRAPVGGENLEERTPWVLVPTPAFFVSGRVADRVVLGGGAYVVSQFGGVYEDVEVLQGQMLSEPADIDIVFGTYELATSMSIEVTSELSIGLGLRLPMSLLDSSQPQVTLGQTVFVQQDLFGVGLPAGRIGLTYQPRDELAIAAVYRTRARVRMNGTLTFSGDFIETLLGGPQRFEGETVWRTTDLLEVGISGGLPAAGLLFAAEYAVYFFDATHDSLDMVVDDPSGGFMTLTGSDRASLPLDWRNAHSVRLGGELALGPLARVRAGFTAVQSASVDATAQFFTPAPGWRLSEYVGLGLAPGDFQIDLALGHSHASADVPPESEYCEPGDALKAGCPGRYSARAFLVGLSATYAPSPAAREPAPASSPAM